MGVFDDIGKSFSDVGSFVNQGVNLIQQYYGFDNKWNWTNKTGIFHAADEGIGEITGRNQSRASLNLARDQFSYAQTQAQGLIKQQQWNRQQNDVIGSNNAAAQTATARATSGATFANATPSALGPGFNNQGGQKDFLGL